MTVFDDGFYPRGRSRGRAADGARGERERGGRRGESARAPGDDDARRWWRTDAGTGDDDGAGRRWERGGGGGGVRQETRGVRERSCVVTARRGEATRGGEDDGRDSMSARIRFDERATRRIDGSIARVD